MTVKDKPMPGQAPVGAAKPAPATSISAWSPFRHTTFTVLWTATVVSNVGGWMYSAASGWLMTGLNPDPLTVSLVQVATSLPMFLFALPAGALADIVDRRRLLIVVEILITAVSAVFAFLVWVGMVTPLVLLAFTFLGGIGNALEAPVWQAIVPALVPKRDLQPSIVANGVGFNISRAIGPALGGIIVAAWGIAAPFWLNAVSNLGVIAGLVWWRSPQTTGRQLPAERFVNANRIGLRYARNNPHLRATLIRGVGFFLFASAHWALLPLVARNQIAGGPELYGVLLGAIGAGALTGAFGLPWLKRRLGPDRLGGAGGGRTPPPLGARSRHRACRESGRRHFVDRGHVGAQRVGPALTAGMGACPRSGTLRHGHVRRIERRQRRLGQTGRFDGPARRPFHRRRRNTAVRAAHLAVEIADRHRHRPSSVDALARAARHS